MTIKGHLSFSNNIFIGTTILGYEIFREYINLYEFIAMYLIFIFGTMIVDIDEPRSYIGRKLFFISLPFKIFNTIFFGLFTFLRLFNLSSKDFNRIFEHRGITHFFITPFLLFCTAYFLQEQINIATAALIISFAYGILSHQVADIFTNTGIKNYFFPFFIGKNTKSPITFQTQGVIETILIVVLNIILVLQLIYFIPEELKQILDAL